MTKPVKLDSTAEREAAEAYAWYEAREAGLGKRFFQHLARTLEQVGHFPEASQPMPGDHAASVRAARIKRFPYRVVFVDLPDHIRVVAVAHQSRLPGYWSQRLSE
ncbi:MAG: type II toxin-antitoxin system RelE/ParE family toxin [Planctomycetes bacterium]|nr:type II toxin-antitoxin system RelE/ParE family toxin [Planctomycetota bacterium]